MRERLSEEEFVKNLAEFEALATELKMPYSVPKCEVYVSDPERGVVANRKFHCQSYTRNYVNLICNYLLSVDIDTSFAFWGDGELNFREIDGTIHGFNAIHYIPLSGDLDDDTQGIIVGSGSGAEALDDYALTTQIATGRAGGELQYYSVETDVNFQYYAWDSVARKFRVTFWRYFLNDSGGDVTVTEVGLVYGEFRSRSIMLIRDLLASSVTVPHLNLLLVRYIVEGPVFPQ